MKINKAPAFQLFASDLLSDTMTWTAQELGVHIRLLCWSWINGPLPSDLARVCRIDPCSEAVWQTVGPKWTLTDDGFINNRLEESRSAQAAYREQQRERGLASARVRAARSTGVEATVPTLVPTLVPTNAPTTVGTSVEPTHGSTKKEDEVEDEDEDEVGRLKTEDMETRTRKFAEAVHLANGNRNGTKADGRLPDPEVSAFIAYWTQAAPGGRKHLWERQRVFDIPKRLTTWAAKINWGRYTGTVAEKQQALVMPRTAAIETTITTNNRN